MTATEQYVAVVVAQLAPQPTETENAFIVDAMVRGVGPRAVGRVIALSRQHDSVIPPRMLEILTEPDASPPTTRKRS